MTSLRAEGLYGAPFSCDIDHVGVSEEKLAGVDQALSELRKSDEEISEVRGRFAAAEPADLEAIDAALSTLAEGVSIDEVVRNPMTTEPAGAPDMIAEEWEDEATEVEVLDESDFVLLVDEGELDELEKVGEDDATKTRPPALPSQGEEGEEGFFKKLFGGKRVSSRPKPSSGS